MRSWALDEIETPEGSRSPVVLFSGEQGRGVLIGLEAGQELGDHQVRESAVLVVLGGNTRVEAGGDAIEAGSGTLVTFEPGERHSVSTDEGARILLLLTPWPGAGHYQAEEAAQARR
jgi:quercetin dioxygenase-like cupin family protein